jgi:hypothetical protein
MIQASNTPPDCCIFFGMKIVHFMAAMYERIAKSAFIGEYVKTEELAKKSLNYRHQYYQVVERDSRGV